MRSVLLAAAAAFVLGLAHGARADVPFTAPAADDRPALDAAMPKLAEAVLATFHNDDRRADLDTRFRLQMVAGRWADAERSLQALHDVDVAAGHPQAKALNLQYRILVEARLIEARDHVAFPEAFTRAFHATMDALDDRTSALVSRAIAADRYPVGISLHVPMRETLAGALHAARAKTSLSDADALALVRAYQVESAYRAFAPLAPALVDQDDRRRYVIEQTTLPVGDGASVCVQIVRPKMAVKLPALMEFTIYADDAVNFSEERRSASNGYVGVTGLSRGKGCGTGAIIPYEHDGQDGAALVDWIARQPWSDGRVATYGASYDGFTQWAIAKHHPKALVAMMDSVDAGPGMDSPMDRGVFLNFGYSWPFYTTDNKTLDAETYGDRARWNRLFNAYYRSGAAYRSLPQIDGAPNPSFAHFLDHPTYDAFWQGLVPFGDQFASIDVPILTTTGYFEGSGDGAVHYLTEQLKRRPDAPHYLVLGPYNHTLGNRGTIDVLGDEVNEVDGMAFDAAAHIDLGALRYQWFDHVLKGAPMPAILQDRVNYEVMGENVWRHVPTLASMGPQILTFHPTEIRDGDMFSLAPGPGARAKAATLRVDLADRSDADRTPVGGGLIDDVIDLKDAIAFESSPFDHAFEFSGLFQADLDVVTNKKDFDFEIAFYEVTPDHKYVQLSYDFLRASQINDPTRRDLFAPGVAKRLNVQASLFTSRRFQKGSRLLVLVEAMKTPINEINYGTGKPVADETIRDAGAPLEITLLGDSTISVPTKPLP
ncbi:MAG TPA: CocE/NonD family hydrolase [Caulobacteraceae bacterium]|jgi:hypothetical protein